MRVSIKAFTTIGNETMDINDVIELARRAGQQLMTLWQQPITVRLKADRTPVTQADQLAHQIIEVGLNRLSPQIPVLSEEGTVAPWTQRQQWRQYWLVDPLDGTKDFVHGRPEFTVNIALIELHRPVLGVVYAPALDKLYYACQRQGAYVQYGDSAARPIHSCQQVPAVPRIVCSRFHADAHLSERLTPLADYHLMTLSSSLKFGVVAEGEADVYPRFGATSQWDTAAGQCVLEVAGGQVVDFNQQPLQYNQRESLINDHFLASGAAADDWRRFFSPLESDS
jgi:3'(2'), 5'-bisphosphate nucleotidase